MSGEATIDEAIRNLAMGAGAGLTGFWVDNAPVGSDPPYATYNGNITTTPSQHGDAKAQRYQRQFQFDFWCTVEQDDPDTVKVLREALNGVRVQLINGERCRINVLSNQRVPEPQGDNLVHYMFTGEVQHSPQVG